MLARIRKSQENDQGFTLIELLVVIIIIGILAAIAIPTFLNQREKGWESQVESALKNGATIAESLAVDDNGSYAAITGVMQANGAVPAGVFADEGYNGTEGVDVTAAVTGGGSGFTLTGEHAQLGARTFVYDSATGVITEP